MTKISYARGALQKLNRYSSVAMLAMLLTGCAAMPSGQQAVQPSTPAVRADASTVYYPSIDLTGRLSVRYQQNEKEEAVHGSFAWTQTTERTLVTLLSPLGQTIATIEVTPAKSTLTQAGKPPRTATNVDALVAETLGWPLPVSGLRQWLQGYFVDANQQELIATPSVTDSLVTSDGWRMRYASWESDGPQSQPNRPKRIDLARSTAHAGDVAIRIVIDSWRPREPS